MRLLRGLVRRREETNFRLCKIYRHTGTGGIHPPRDKLGLDVAKLSSATIPLGRLA